MESIKELVKEYLHDQLFEADCIMKSKTQENFTIVADNLRGVCGITVVTITEPAKSSGSEGRRGIETSRLKIKFFQIEPTMGRQLARMQLDAKKIDGVVSFVPLNARKVVSRIYRPKTNRMVAQEE